MSDLSLQDLITSALQDAKQRLSADVEENKNDTRSRSDEAVEEKTASYVDPEYIEKLASSIEYITQKLAEGSVVAPANPQGALKATKSVDGPPPPHKKTKPAGGKDAASAAGESLGTGVAGGRSQIANDLNDVPGGPGGYPAKGVLVNGPRAEKVAALKSLFQDALLKAAESAAEEEEEEEEEENESKAEKKKEKALKKIKKAMMGKAPGDAPEAPVAKYRSGNISAHKRESLKSSQFAIPKRTAKRIGVEDEIKGEAKGKYPIHDLAHARNALARVSAYGTPAEKKIVREKVYAKYPQLRENSKEKKAAALKELLLNKLAGEDVFPAQISAPKDASPLVGGSVLKVTDSSQPPAYPTGYGNENRKLIQSNQAAINYTKGKAKAPVKRQLAEVLDEPALSRKTDPVLHDAWQSTDKAGVKIAHNAMALLQKVAEEGTPEQQERLLAVMERANLLPEPAQEKTASAECDCGGEGSCMVCKLTAALSA